MSLPKLTPRTSSWMHEIIEDVSLQQQLLSTYGSPINLHHLPSFDHNIQTFKNCLDAYNINYQIFYARKANKCKSLVARSFLNKIGVDTASLRELEECISLGIPSKYLVVTAAIKNEELITYAIKNDVLIILDNDDEVTLTVNIAKGLKKKAIVGFRVSGFLHNNTKLKSRFGFDMDMIRQYIKSKIFQFITSGNLEVQGFHFHLDGYSTSERGNAIHQILNSIEELEALGLNFKFIDIGGGILMNYLQSSTEWNRFKQHLQNAVKGVSPPITYNNNGLGYHLVDKKVLGELSTYPFYNENSTVTFLAAVLNKPNQSGETVAKRLQRSNIELRLEPGRSLLDQVGMTIAKVAFRKQNAAQEYLIGLEMNMSQMASSSADFLLDPFVSYQQEPDNDDASVGVFFTGAYCLERDILLKRKIEINKIPEIGDTVSFVNTAGYMMHFFETEAHLFQLSQNLIIDKNIEKITPD